MMKKGPPVCARQQPAGRGQEDPVGPREQWPAGSSPEDGEFVTAHDDFQRIALVGATAESRQLKETPNHHITEGEEHERLQSPPNQRPFYAGRIMPSLSLARSV